MFSPKRSTLFETLKSDVTLSTGQSLLSLRSLCATRWTVRIIANLVFYLKNYKTLRAALDEIQEECDNMLQSSGLLNKMKEFDTFIGLKLSFLLYLL